MVDHWHTDEPLYDIGPMPWGDGTVDAQDLIILSEHLFEEDRLMAHWALDEAEGDIAYDSAGLNDAFVIGGALWQPAGGQVDGALALDGVDDYVVAGPILNPADGPFTVITWVKGGAPGQVIISQAGGDNWLCVDASEGNFMTELRFIGGRLTEPPLMSQTLITDDAWHRVALSWDGANRILYVDGVEVAKDTQPGFASSEGGLNIGIGKDMALGTHWSGLIDDVRVYSRAITP
jgi:signal peptidase